MPTEAHIDGDPMPKIEVPDRATPIVAVIGGAVAGSEAAAFCARHGAIAVVFEQADKPYGKIEDGLPRWHEKLRDQEYEKIDANLSEKNVLFVPRTTVGRDVSLEELRSKGFSAVILANGAWRDRAVPIEGIERFVGKGLVYQNAFVQWFNHKHEPDYAGPTFTVAHDAIVLGGGLASIDVAKIINLELYVAALAARGITADVVQMEVLGIPETLAKHGLSPADLGVGHVTLYYRRRKQDMPLAAAAGTEPAQIAKAETARVKIMERVERKYLVRFEGLVSPVAPIEEEGRLVGLRFVRNEATATGVKPIEGSEHDVRAPLVVSSIGSIPVPMPGVPMKGELYDYEDYATGRVRGLRGVFGLGNVLTGKGNIRDSRENAGEIAEQIVSSYLGIGELPRDASLVSAAVEGARIVAAAALREAPAPVATIEAIEAWVESRWEAIGYPGDYRGHIARFPKHA